MLVNQFRWYRGISLALVLNSEGETFSYVPYAAYPNSQNTDASHNINNI